MISVEILIGVLVTGSLMGFFVGIMYLFFS